MSLKPKKKQSDALQRIALMDEMKKEGNASFAKKDYRRALAVYNSSLEVIGFELPNLQNRGRTLDLGPAAAITEKIDRNDIFHRFPKTKADASKVLSNESECYLRLKEYKNAISTASLALVLNSTNEKAVFRMAKAHECLEEYKPALEYYSQLLKNHPKNTYALEGARRVGALMAKTSDRVSMYTRAIRQLDAKFRQWLRQSLAQVSASDSDSTDSKPRHSAAADHSTTAVDSTSKKRSSEPMAAKSDESTDKSSAKSADSALECDSSGSKPLAEYSLSDDLRLSESPLLREASLHKREWFDLGITGDDENEVMALIGTAMNQVQDNRSYHRAIVDLEFTRLLLNIAANASMTWRIRQECIRALIVCLRQFTDKATFSSENKQLILDSFGVDLAYYMLEVKFVISQLKRYQKTGDGWREVKQWLKSVKRKEAIESKVEDSADVYADDSDDDIYAFDSDNELKKPLSKEECDYMCLLVSLMCDLHANQYIFPEYGQKIQKLLFASLIESLNVPYTCDLVKGIEDYGDDISASTMTSASSSSFSKRSTATSAATADATKRSTSVGGLSGSGKSDVRSGERIDALSANVRVINCLIRRLGFIALRNSSPTSGDWKLFNAIRQEFSQLLLQSEAIENASVRYSIVRFLVCCSGLKSAFDEISDKRLLALKATFEASLTKCIKRPLVSAFKRGDMTQSNSALLKALVGLSCVLQSNWKLGAAIAGTEEVLNLLVLIASDMHTDAEAISAAQSAFKASGGSGTVDASKALKGAPKKKPTVPKLSTIPESKTDASEDYLEGASVSAPKIAAGTTSLMLSAFGKSKLRYIACELLALSCTSQPIRLAIAQSKNAHIFAWVLSAKNQFVRANAACALAKFAAVEEDARELALGGGGDSSGRCLQVCMQLVNELLSHSGEFAKMKAKRSRMVAGTGEYYDYFEGVADACDKQRLRTGASDEGEAEDFEERQLPLMNLCIEAVSYLSLHIEVKRSLIVREKGQWMKTLLSLSDTRFFALSRAVRHGLLTSILNCSVSRKDSLRFLTEKEKQIDKLKRVASKGLTDSQNPVKEDDMLHSFAGADEEIATLQAAMLEIGCVKTLSDIVCATAKESSILEQFADDEFGGKSVDDSVSTKRHKLIEKSKFMPIELETGVQLRISQVLLKFAQGGSPVYDGLRKPQKGTDETDDSAEKTSEEPMAAALDTSSDRRTRTHRELVHARGRLVQQNAIRLLLDLFTSNSIGKGKYNEENEKIRLNCGAAIARIGVSINPALINASHLKPMVAVLLYLVKNATHQLPEYESLICLCNLSSLSDELREDILDKCGWHVLRDSFEEEHPSINAAILECWCNLTVGDKGLDYLTRNRETDLKIICLFLRHESNRVLLAVTALLAMASVKPENCGCIARFGGVVALHVVLDAKQMRLIDRDVSEFEKQQCMQLIHRVKMALANLEENGLTLENMGEHKMEEDILKEIKESAATASAMTDETMSDSEEHNSDTEMVDLN